MYTVHHIDQKFVTMFRGTESACRAYMAKNKMKEVRAWRGTKVDQFDMFKLYVS